jgi:hypothetical protein
MLRSELAYEHAVSCVARRELDAAEAALDEVGPDAGVFYARGLQLRGRIAETRGEYVTAAALLRAAIEHLDRARLRDDRVASDAIAALSTFAVELLDRALWRFVGTRANRIAGDDPHLAEGRFWVALARAQMEELEGRGGAATRAARLAEERAPSPRGRLHARLRRATIARLNGDAEAQRDHALHALTIIAELGEDDPSEADRRVMLTLAEELAHAGEVSHARAALHGYADAMPARTTNDPRGLVYARLVEGAIAEAAGERVEAHHAYRDAFQGFRAMGYRRHALVAALRLADLGEQPYLYDYVAAEVREFSARSWFGRRVVERDAPSPRAAVPSGTQSYATNSVPLPANAALIAP